jgi:hypothetical protein
MVGMVALAPPHPTALSTIVGMGLFSGLMFVVASARSEMAQTSRSLSLQRFAVVVATGAVVVSAAICVTLAPSKAAVLLGIMPILIPVAFLLRRAVFSKY